MELAINLKSLMTKFKGIIIVYIKHTSYFNVFFLYLFFYILFMD